MTKAGERTVFGYRLVTLGSTTSLCARGESTRWRHEAGLPDRGNVFDNRTEPKEYEMLTIADDKRADEADYVILLRGELYFFDGTLLSKPSPKWINVACMRDSLAKLDLYDLKPAQVSTDPVYLKQRMTALRMLTANYCGNRDRYTASDTEINWAFPALNAWPGSIKTIEAEWNEHGAICISSSRLYNGELHDGDVVFPPGCAGGKCNSDATFAKEIRDECANVRTIGPCSGYMGGIMASAPSRKL